MSIEIENEDTPPKTINIGGISEKTNDVTTFNIREDDNSDYSDEKSLSTIKPNIKPVNYDSDGTLSVDEKKTFRKPPANFNYSMYADPKKIKEEEENNSDEEYSESESESDDNYSENSSNVESQYNEKIETEPKKPALSRLQLKIKKKEMLLKLYEAEKNGYALTGKYNMNSDLEEMEAEYELYEKKIEQSTMTDFLQDGLMFLIKGIEVLNGMYNPLNLKLNGLSDQIYDRKEKLEHVFRRLAVKYSGGTEMPPELSLLFIIGGAIVMTHISNSALQGGGIPGLSNILGNTNIMDSISKIMSNITPPAPVAQNEPSPTNTTMKPPNIDISNILKNMKETKPIENPLPFKAMSVPTPGPRPQTTKEENFDDRFSVTSSLSSEDESTVNISVGNNKRKQKRSIQI